MSGMQDVKASVGEDDLFSGKLESMNAVRNLLERPYHSTMIASRCAPFLAPTRSRCGLPAGVDSGIITCAETRFRNISDRAANAIHPLFTHQHSEGQGPCHPRSEEHTSELQSLTNLVCRLLLEKKK